MKKLIVLLLALAMVGAVFAQAAAPALTFSGYLNTGFQYDTGTDLVKLYGAYAGQTSRLRLNAAYTNGDFGVNFRYQSNDSATAPTVGQALVWGNLFNKMVTFKAGKLNDYTWATPYNAFGNFDGQTGVQVQLKPVAGLNFGVFVPLVAAGATPANTFKDMSIAGKYSASGLADFLVNLNLGTAANALYGSVNVTAVKDLTAILEAKVTDLTKVSTTLYMDQYLSYAMGDLSVGAYIDQTFGTPFGWSVSPEVDYTMGNVELYASFTYASDKTWSINPYVNYTLNSKSSVKTYASYDNTKTFTVGSSFVFNF
ncbi:hypothetical protein [Rectinema subterraneum]|uniref:hypothetical protein n=1 Tax=Rectinema subterraneum TaxID=2653714 RepID=UPI00131C92E2|nr:hypothetical protein [Rectinema subterraneum]